MIGSRRQPFPNRNIHICRVDLRQERYLDQLCCSLQCLNVLNSPCSRDSSYFSSCVLSSMVREHPDFHKIHKSRKQLFIFIFFWLRRLYKTAVPLYLTRFSIFTIFLLVNNDTINLILFLTTYKSNSLNQ